MVNDFIHWYWNGGIRHKCQGKRIPSETGRKGRRYGFYRGLPLIATRIYLAPSIFLGLLRPEERTGEVRDVWLTAWQGLASLPIVTNRPESQFHLFGTQAWALPGLVSTIVTKSQALYTYNFYHVLHWETLSFYVVHLSSTNLMQVLCDVQGIIAHKTNLSMVWVTTRIHNSLVDLNRYLILRKVVKKCPTMIFFRLE